MEKDPDYQDGKGTDTVTYRIELPPDVDPAHVGVSAPRSITSRFRRTT